MNFFGYMISRIVGMILVSLLVVAIQMAGARFSQNKKRASYEQLGALVSDPGSSRLSWFFWPPHYRLLGRFQGRSFRYEIQKPQVSHLYIDCMPRATLAYDARPRGQRLPEAKAFPAWSPHWTVLMATQQPVSLWKNAADRRPLGFGSHPGVDLHREGAAVFDAVALREDLQELSNYCAE